MEGYGFLEGRTKKINNTVRPKAFSPVKSDLPFHGAEGVASVFSLKPLQGSGGGIQRLFNINNNNKRSFIPDLFREKLQPIQSSFVPGDEPLKYIDSQHSKQLAVQKRFYQRACTNRKEDSQEL